MHAAVALGLLAASPLSAVDKFYVEIGHAGTNAGTSANPWTSLASIAWAGIGAGDIVYVAKGTGASYGTFTPGASGSAATSAGRIWIVGTGGTGSAAPLLTSVSDGDRSYIGVVNFAFTSSGGSAFNMTAAVGWYIADVYITAKSQAFFFSRTTNNQYNTVCGATTTNLAIAERASEIGGTYNVFHYVSGNIGGDMLDIFGHHNVYRNCYHGQMLAADLGTAPDPHVDLIQTWNIAGNPANWNDLNLMEANSSYRQLVSNSHYAVLQGTSGALGGMIMRGNISDFHGSRGGGEYSNFSDTRAYNNLFKDSYYLFVPLNSQRSNAVRIYNGSTNHEWVNNSFVRSNWDGGDPFGSSALTGDYNHEYFSGTFDNGSNNVSNTAPQFTDESARNYMPVVGSPLRGAQRYQTPANGAGSGSVTLVVDDASWFTDGWTIVEGDLIRIGGGPWIRISSINYGTDTITLATADTWADNDPVEVFGYHDAIGPYPYNATGYTLTGTISNAGNDYTVTASDSTICRMVIFYEDGVPQAPDYDAPYTFTSAATVTAKLYPRYAVTGANAVTSLVIDATAGTDTTAPTLQSATVAANGTTVTLVWSEACTRGAGWNNGDIDLDASTTGNNIALTYVSGDGTTSWTTTAASTIQAPGIDTVNLDLNGDANSVEDAAGNDLATIANASVTNNSEQGVTGTVGDASVSLAAGPYFGAQTITITGDAGATYYYTTDGSDPDAGDTAYAAPFQLSTGTTLKVIGIRSGWTNSAIVTRVYEIGSWAGTTTFKSMTVPQQTTTFDFQFVVVPGATNIDLTPGFGPATISAHTDMAIIVRFNTSGTIDAINGGGYSAVTSFAYAAGQTYTVTGAANITTKTYSFNVNGTAIATNYAFRTEQAAAADIDNFGLRLSSGTATVSALSFDPGETAPAAPSGLTVSGSPTSSTATVTWTDNSGSEGSGSEETGFEVELSTTSGVAGFSLVATTAVDVETYQFTGLPAATQHWARVRAVNVAGNSAYATAATFTTASVVDAPGGTRDSGLFFPGSL